MNNKLKEEEEKLVSRMNIWEDTCGWWSNIIQMKMSRYIFLSEKLKEKWNDEYYQEFQNLENEIKHLNLKKEWEIREKEKIDFEINKLAKKMSKDILSELSSKISQKMALNKPIKKPKLKD